MPRRFALALVCASLCALCACDAKETRAPSSDAGGAGTASHASATSSSSRAAASSSSGEGGASTSAGGTGGAGGGSAGSGGLAIDPVCAAYADARCAREFECLPFWYEWVFGDAATCAAAEALTCTLDLGAPGSARTHAVVQACADAYVAASCEVVKTNDVPECRVLPGQQPTGSACGSDWQCEGRRCMGAFENGCGTCQSAVAAGGSCADDFRLCDDGIACSSETCVLPVGLGQPCSSSTPCAASLACSQSTSTCAPAGAPGDSCVDVECDWSIGSFCDAAQCVQGQSAGIGEECSPTCKGGFCVTMLTSECTARRAEGESCDSSAFCAFPLRCVADVCTLVDPAAC